jgi:hypothetical protein
MITTPISSGAPIDTPRSYDVASIAPGVVEVNAMTIVYTAFATVNRTQLKMQQDAMQNQLRETMSAAAEMRNSAKDRFKAALSNGIAGIAAGCLSGVGAAHAHLGTPKITPKSAATPHSLAPDSLKVNTQSAEKMNAALSVKVAPATSGSRKALSGKNEKLVSAEDGIHAKANKKPGADATSNEKPNGEDNFAESNMKATYAQAKMQTWESIGKVSTGAGQIGAGFGERNAANNEADAKEHDGSSQLYGADASRLATQNEGTASFEKSVADALVQNSQNVNQTNKGMFQK